MNVTDQLPVIVSFLVLVTTVKADEAATEGAKQSSCFVFGHRCKLKISGIVQVEKYLK